MSAPDGVDASVPNAARMYDYYLGGKDNFAADRVVAEQVLAAAPWMREAAHSGRRLIKRAVEHMIRDLGIRQILDIGSGLPTAENVHEIAHAVDPTVRVVYVDIDEVVCNHGRALLTQPDLVLMARHDVREPDVLLADPAIRGVLNFDQPVGMMMMFLLHLIADADQPHAMVAAYRDALPSGSVLAISHAADDARPEWMANISRIYQRASAPFVPRSKAEIARFFGDFTMVPPGLVNAWPYPRVPDGMDPGLAQTGYGGLGVKP